MLHLRMLGPVMLMFLLCDADSTCPTALNPVTLDPPEVIGEYGESVFVNCTSTNEDHEGIYWELGNTKTDMEDEKAFLPLTLSLSDWNVTAKCRIILNDSLECSKDLKITIYKTPDTVSLSALDQGLMVEGSEYELKCDIINVAPVQNLKVRWYRDNETVKTETFNDTSVSPVNVSVTLRVTAERDYNGAHFRCEAELYLGPKGPEFIPTASSPYTAVVLYEPLMQPCPDDFSGVEHEFRLDMLPCQADGNPPPTVQWYYQGKPINASEPLTRTHSGKYTAEFVNSMGSHKTSVDITIEYAPELKKNAEYVFVYEGSDVNLICEAEGNPPPVFDWTSDLVTILENTAYLNITRVLTSTTYNCTATNYLGSITKQIHVNVIKLTRTASPGAMTTPKTSVQRAGCPLTLTPAEVVVRFGDPVSVNCSTSATDAQGMGWEATLGGTGFENRSAITWVVEKLEEWRIEPNCYVTLMNNDQCSVMPTITLYKTPDTVLLSALDRGLMVEGTEYELKCDIINVTPVQNLKVRWYRDNETVKTETFNDTSVSPVNVSGILRVTAKRDYNGAHFRCEAELHLGPKGPEFIPTAASSPYTAVVLYEPLIQACPDHYSGVEHEFILDMLSCQADGNPPPTVQWYYQGKPINAFEPLTQTHSGKYTAEFVNSMGSYKTSVDITIEYSPSITCNDRYAVREDAKPQTTCEPNGIPTPAITWFKDGKDVATPQHWTRHDSGNYLFKATNKHGTATHMIYLDVLYAPVFKEGSYSKEVTLGENVTFACHAEGNPPPEIVWDYTSAVNVMETTGWRQKNISVTGATSTNAGVYVCRATNKVGGLTRSVTLMIKGSTSAISSTVIWGLLTALIIAIILIFIVVYYSLCKKHGQYSFVPDKATEGSDRSIPMTDKSGGVHV